MITESDLRAVLTDEARDISEPAEILARLQVAEPQPIAKRRWLTPLAAAAAVAAAVVVAGTLVVEHRAGHRDQPASTRPSALGRDLWFTPYVHPIEGYDVTAISMDNSAVGIGVRYPGHTDSEAGDITAYAPGIWDPALAKGSTRLTVHGRPAYYGVMNQGGYMLPTLAWQSGSGGWIVIRGWNDAAARSRHLDPRTEELRVAAKVDDAAAERLHLPFRIGYLPAGLQFARVSVHLTKPAGDTQIVFSQTGTTHYDRTGTLSDRTLPAGMVSIILSPNSQPGQPTVRNTKVDGHDADFNEEQPDGQRILTVYVAGGSLTLQGPYSKAELIKIFRSIVLAPDVDDPATWFDATK